VGLEIRKVVTFVEEVHTEGGRADGVPLVKVAAAAVVKNPYAGRPYSEDLSELVDPSPELAALLGKRARDASVVGTAGEQEHGVATKTAVAGDAFREAVGGGKAWLPSVSKRGAPGSPVDVPLCFKDEIWVRSHYDTVTVSIADAPLPDEIVVIFALASRGRLNARLGGVAKDEA
jgi:hypothetical protein